MFAFIKKLFGLPTAEEQATAKAAAKIEESAPKRAKDTRGKFAKDDPATPKNEAWVGGKSPAKKPKAKKPVAKKSSVKK